MPGVRGFGRLLGQAENIRVSHIGHHCLDAAPPVKYGVARDQHLLSGLDALDKGHRLFLPEHFNGNRGGDNAIGNQVVHGTSHGRLHILIADFGDSAIAFIEVDENTVCITKHQTVIRAGKSHHQVPETICRRH